MVAFGLCLCILNLSGADFMIGPEFSVTEPVSSRAGGHQHLPAVAANDQFVLVVWLDRPDVNFAFDLYGMRLSKSGVLLDTNRFPLHLSKPTVAWPALASDGQTFVAVWMELQTNSFRIYGSSVSFEGAPHLTGRELIDDGSAFAEKPMIAGGTNGLFLIVWQQHHANNRYDVYGAVFDARQNVVRKRFPIANTAAQEYLPAIAFNGTHFLVVWEDDRSGVSDIYGSLISTDGTMLQPDGFAICSQTSYQTGPSATAHPATREFLVSWTDFRNQPFVGTGTDIYAARVTPAGAVLDPNGVPIQNAIGDQVNSRVTTSGDEYFVLAQSSIPQPSWYGTRLTTNGTVWPAAMNPALPVLAANGVALLSGETNVLAVYSEVNNVTSGDIEGFFITPRSDSTNAPFIIGLGPNEQTAPAVASLSGGFLAVWQDSRNNNTNLMDIYGARIDGAGNVLNPTGFAICLQPAYQSSPSVASDGKQFLVVWRDNRNQTASGDDIYGTFVSAHGIVSHPAGFPICTERSSQRAPRVAGNTNGFLVVWRDGRTSNAVDIFGTRIRSNGEIVDPQGFVICTVTNDQQAPAIAAGPGGFLVVWRDSRNQDTAGDDIYGARVTFAEGLIETNSIAIATAPTIQRAPDVASDGTNYLVAWRDDRDLFFTSGSRIYGARVGADGRVLDTNNLALSSSLAFQREPVVAPAPGGFMVSWHDHRNERAPGIYATRVRSNGTLLTGAERLVNLNLSNDEILVSSGSGANKVLIVTEGPRDGAARLAANLVHFEPWSTLIVAQTPTPAGLELEWESVPGIRYTVQATEDLQSRTWRDLALPAIATTNRLSYTDPGFLTVPRRFYRVVNQQTP
jgi:hypothetical protein